MSEQFKQTCDRKPFLQKVEFVTVSDEAFLLFCSEEGKALLASQSCWSGDGTFSTAPKFFEQVMKYLSNIGT